ncbi:MAG: hypothetical protein Q4G09_03005 [Clostridia bacterium]|nr:hypothetical protein [Clostridia bacterium]
MEEKEIKRDELISINTAIKYAKASVYALKHSVNKITPKEVEKEMIMHYERYNEKMVDLLIKAYEQEEKRKCSK